MSAPDATSAAPAWRAAHDAACAQGAATYADPRTGYQVFTRVGLEALGECCGAGCRHCPYAHANVKGAHRAQRIQQPALLHTPEHWPAHAKEIPEGQGAQVVFWSGGKDSFLALRAWLNRHGGARERVLLLTTFDASSRVIAHQRVHIEQVQRQAEALGLPLLGVPLHAGADYGERMAAAFACLRELGLPAQQLIFGDLHLEHIRGWRERSFAELGASLHFPLWHADPQDLLRELLATGVPCTLSACPANDTLQLPAAMPGRPFDADFVDLARAQAWDPFGEGGEFHTLAQVWQVGAAALAPLAS